MTTPPSRALDDPHLPSAQLLLPTPPRPMPAVRGTVRGSPPPAGANRLVRDCRLRLEPVVGRLRVHGPPSRPVRRCQKGRGQHLVHLGHGPAGSRSSGRDGAPKPGTICSAGHRAPRDRREHGNAQVGCHVEDPNSHTRPCVWQEGPQACEVGSPKLSRSTPRPADLVVLPEGDAVALHQFQESPGGSSSSSGVSRPRSRWSRQASSPLGRLRIVVIADAGAVAHLAPVSDQTGDHSTPPPPGRRAPDKLKRLATALRVSRSRNWRWLKSAGSC